MVWLVGEVVHLYLCNVNGNSNQVAPRAIPVAKATTLGRRLSIGIISNTPNQASRPRPSIRPRTSNNPNTWRGGRPTNLGQNRDLNRDPRANSHPTRFVMSFPPNPVNSGSNRNTGSSGRQGYVKCIFA